MRIEKKWYILKETSASFVCIISFVEQTRETREKRVQTWIKKKRN